MVTPTSAHRPPAVTRHKAGLRERKKAKTRTVIQTEAVRLFTEHGYAPITVEHVAAAADVSPSTVFRYFPTKADLVLASDGGSLSALDALRHLAAAPASGRTDGGPGRPAASESGRDALTARSRWRLILTVPDLRTALLSTFEDDVQHLAHRLAHRTGQQADPCVRADAGAMLGALLAVALNWAESADAAPTPVLDTALQRIAHGVPSAGLGLSALLELESTEAPAPPSISEPHRGDAGRRKPL